jgi:hypothetical protein
MLDYTFEILKSRLKLNLLHCIFFSIQIRMVRSHVHIQKGLPEVLIRFVPKIQTQFFQKVI